MNTAFDWGICNVHVNKANKIVYLSCYFIFSAAFDTTVVRPFRNTPNTHFVWQDVLMVLCLLLISLPLDEGSRCTPKWQVVWPILHQMWVTSLPSKVMSRNKNEKQQELPTQNPLRDPSFPFFSTWWERHIFDGYSLMSWGNWKNYPFYFKKSILQTLTKRMSSEPFTCP